MLNKSNLSFETEPVLQVNSSVQSHTYRLRSTNRLPQPNRCCYYNTVPAVESITVLRQAGFSLFVQVAG